MCLEYVSCFHITCSAQKSLAIVFINKTYKQTNKTDNRDKNEQIDRCTDIDGWMVKWLEEDNGRIIERD